MLHFLWNVAAFILSISILITVHEYGHFWVARRCGVKIVRFSIGFGRALWRWTNKSGTEYTISAIPLGGYVKMLDERVDIVLPEQRHETFNQKTIWQRAMIITAGPFFNFLFALFAYWLIFMIGIPVYRPIIGDIIPSSIVEQAKFCPGMELKSVDGIETPDWDSVRFQLINRIGKNVIHVSVIHFGSTNQEIKTLDLSNWEFELGKQDPVISLGIIPLSAYIEPVIHEVKLGSSAVKAGLQAGDRIIKIDDQLVSTWHFFVSKIRDNPDRILKINIDRTGQLMDIYLKPDSKVVNKEKIEGIAGIIPKSLPLPEGYKNIRQLSPFKALIDAGEKIYQLMCFTIRMLGKLIIGDIKLNNLSGPIFLAQGARISSEHGWMFYLIFLAMISVNLGITNLFPLPLLDGGHLFFLMIEKIKGGPVSERVQHCSYRIGSILLMLLIGITILNDLSRLR